MSENIGADGACDGSFAPSVTPDDADYEYSPDMIALKWVNAFGEMMESADTSGFDSLFVEDAWWRDLVAVTWDIRSTPGRMSISGELGRYAKESLPRGFRVSANPAPTFAWRSDKSTDILVAFEFETQLAMCRGVVRLVSTEAGWKAWIIVTEMLELKGYEEAYTRLSDVADPIYTTAYRDRPTYEQLSSQRIDFYDSDPVVLVVGAGHSGLMLAARLEHLGLPTLVVDRQVRLGDNWRQRYNGLALHDAIWRNTFPYLPFPDNWPVFVPKDMMADWHEIYAKALQLRTWNRANVLGATFNEQESRWTVAVDHAGRERILRPSHLVFATGNSGTGTVPEVPGLEKFRGTVHHSSSHQGGGDLEGKRVVIIGSATSAHDVAQDSYEMGAESITMVQRGPTYVMSARNGVQLLGSSHNESVPVEESDVWALAGLPALTIELLGGIVQKVESLDQGLWDGLTRAGFDLETGRGGGHTEISLRRVGGYYIDKGCSQLIIDGHVRVQKGEVVAFTEHGVKYADGSYESADLVVFSTGFENMREAVRPICGDEVTDSLSPVWGLDEYGEIKGLFRQTEHRNLWFFAGAFGQGRRHSKHVALQILAIEEGLLSHNPRLERERSAPSQESWNGSIKVG